MLRLVFLNTYLLSVIYLVAGLTTELCRRFIPGPFVRRLSFALDALPSRALMKLGLMEHVRDWYESGRLNDLELRVLFSLTTLLVIFVLALVLGAVLSTLQRVATRPRP